MTLTEKIAAYAENVREEVVQLLRDMCRIPAPSNHEEKRAAFCKEWLEKQGAKKFVFYFSKDLKTQEYI